MRVRVWAVVAVALCAFQGCGRGHAASSKELPGARKFGLTDEQFVDHINRVETGIANCMRQQAFEYVPVDVQTVQSGIDAMRSEPGLTRVEYKQKWGYGVTTRFDDPVRDKSFGPQNQAIFAALSPADQAAYNHALYGDNDHESFAFGLDEEDFSRTGGCTRTAVAAVFTKEQLRGDWVNPKDELIDSDKRIAAARKKWVGCMEDAGYKGYTDQDQYIDELQKRLAALTQGDDPQALTGSRLDALKSLQDEERKFAVVDVNCQIKYTDAIYYKVETEVYGKPFGGPLNKQNP